MRELSPQATEGVLCRIPPTFREEPKEKGLPLSMLPHHFETAPVAARRGARRGIYEAAPPSASTSSKTGIESAAPGRVTLMDEALLARRMQACSGMPAMRPAMK